jgi:hypothetical protein
MAKIKNKQISITSDFDFNSQKIINLANPVGDNDAVNKAYVDSVAAGLDPKESCRVATTENISLSGLQTIDGFTLNDGERVLVKNQTDKTENGIYIASETTWSRSDDMDGSPSHEVSIGNFSFVESGSTYAGTGWVVSSSGATGSTIDVGTDDIEWIQFSAAGVYTSGDGLTLSGTEFSVENADSTIGVGANGISVSSSVMDDISDNTSDIATNSTNIASNSATTSTNASAISSNATDIASNSATTSTNASAISSNATDIASNSATTSTNASAISSNSTNIASNETAISSNATDISTISGLTNQMGVNYIQEATTNPIASNTTDSVGISLQYEPAGDCYVECKINGISYGINPNSASATSTYPFYFTSGSRTNWGSGDSLQVDTGDLGFELEASDLVQLTYSVKPTNF